MRLLSLYTISIAFVTGIVWRTASPMSTYEIAFVGVIALACGVAGLLRKRAQQPFHILLMGCGVLCFCMLGMFRFHMSDVSLSTFAEFADTKVSFQGVIAREPEVRESTVHLYIDPIDIGGDSGELVLVTTDRFRMYTQDISYGDIVSVSGIFTLPKAFETETGRVFNYQKFLRSKGVHFVLNYAHVEMVTEEGGTFLGRLFYGKRVFQETIEGIIPEPHAGLGEGILLGVKRAIPKDLEQVFRDTGIIHIVVLSGYNIMLVVEGVMFVLAFFFFPRTRALIGIVIISLFALLVGLTATVVRASLMASLVLVARATGKTYGVLRALIITGVCMLIHNPYLLAYDPGFQLSFLATLGLIVLSPYLDTKCTRVTNFLGIRTFLTATLATQIMVLPLLLFHMGTFSLVAVLVNVLALPMVPVAMLLTFFTGIIGMASHTVGFGLGYITYLSLGYIIVVAEFFAQLPFASFTLQSFPLWALALSYTVLIGALFGLLRNEHVPEKEIPKIISNLKSDAYGDWTIVDDDTKAPETRSVSGAVPPFPFR